MAHAAPARLTREVYPVAADDQTATRQTIAAMCAYVRDSLADPLVNEWAKAAGARLALPFQNRAAAIVWGVFWLLKHQVRFRPDEPALFRTGDGDARDLLISPTALVRMPAPAEDCDGFAMLAAALLTILKVPCYLVTLKCDPTDRSRWSHVFCLARIGPGETDCDLVAVDPSKGDGPGWMVPAEHTFAWQAWSLDGKPANLGRPRRRGLQGYARRASRMGLSQGDTVDVGYTDPNAVPPVDTSTLPQTLPAVPFSVPSVSPSPASQINWTSFLNNLVGGATRVATVAELPPGSVVNPTTGFVATGSPGGVNPLMAGAAGSAFGGLGPLLLIGGALVALMLFAGGRK